MSRAEPERRSVPDLGRAFRAAATDFYFNSWRLVPANLLWGAMFIGLLMAVSMVPALVVLMPLLALPTVGLFRISGLIVRGESASFWDGVAAWRTLSVPTLLLGGALAGCDAVFVANIATGLGNGDVIGWSLLTMAVWGLVASWILGWVLWPLIADPARSGRPIRDNVRTALLVIFAQPVRMAGLGAILVALFALSTIAFAALVTISVAYATLVTTRLVLPSADRFDVPQAEADTVLGG